jgi:hypothetical protein
LCEVVPRQHEDLSHIVHGLFTVHWEDIFFGDRLGRLGTRIAWLEWLGALGISRFSSYREYRLKISWFILRHHMKLILV